MTNSLIYLASPYSHPDNRISCWGYSLVRDAVGFLFHYGYHVISPVIHCHDVSQVCNLPFSWDFWKPYCSNILKRCDMFTVLCLEDWSDSIGVMEELTLALSLSIPITYLLPYDLFRERRIEFKPQPD